LVENSSLIPDSTFVTDTGIPEIKNLSSKEHNLQEKFPTQVASESLINHNYYGIVIDTSIRHWEYKLNLYGVSV